MGQLEMQYRETGRKREGNDIILAKLTVVGSL